MSNGAESHIEKKNTNPSIILKCKALICTNGLFCFVITFSMSLLFNFAQCRMYLLLSYILLRFLLPGGSLGCEYGDGGVWRNFSENLFVYGSVLREYLELSLNDRQLPKEFVKEESLDGAQFIFAAFPPRLWI